MSYADSNPSGIGSSARKVSASLLTPYSIGQAAANILVGQTELEVWPIEKFTQVDGEVTDHQTITETKGVDGSGSHYSDSVKSSISIRAKWLSRDPWLKFPGLVRRGEYVQIWRMGDSDQYYWEILGTTNHLRRKDIVLLVVSNTEDETVTELTPTNSVIFELNTVDKHITLLTPNNDGEGCKYTIQLNYGDSTFSLSDDIGNSMVMDSLKHLIQLRNASDSFISLDKHEILHEANERIYFRTKHFELDSQTTHLKGDSFTGDYGDVTWNGSAYAVNHANITLNGNTINTGSFSGKGKATMSSGMDVSGGASIDGGINANGGLIVDGKDIGPNHTHRDSGSGPVN